MEYKTLMEGENRFWYPQLDPLEVLGINAKNEEERAHYAERYVKKTQERIQKELKFIEMVERKWKELLSFKKDKE